MAEVTLSAAVRSNLLSLQATTGLINRTQGRLATGLSISSPIDDAVKFFQAKTLSDRATDLTSRKDGIDQGVSSLQTVLEATDALESLTDQLKGVIDSARSGTKDQRKEFGVQINELIKQVQRLVNDASFQGLNLLNSTSASLTVRFSEKTDSKLQTDGVDFNASKFFLSSANTALGLAATGITVSNLGKLGFQSGAGSGILLSAFSLSVANDLASFNSYANLAIGRLDKTVENLRAKSATIASNVAILQVRLDFTSNYVEVLQGGADKLRLADLNEEGANLLALQTRQQLGIQSLAFAGQSEQSILGLFR
jgi:flagellin